MIIEKLGKALYRLNTYYVSRHGVGERDENEGANLFFSLPSTPFYDYPLGIGAMQKEDLERLINE